jgi:hypothetical protein
MKKLTLRNAVASLGKDEEIRQLKAEVRRLRKIERAYRAEHVESGEFLYSEDGQCMCLICRPKRKRGGA